MPLLTEITTEAEKQIGITEDKQRVLLSDPIPCFDHQKSSKEPHHLGDELKKKARKDEDYYYQVGTYRGFSGCDAIGYIRWNGKVIEDD